MDVNHPLLIVTDLDGSLLDHHTYSFAAAIQALQQINTRQIPLILNTSKTIAEVETLRLQLNNTHPFIVENGAGVAIPNGYFSRQDGSLIDSGGYQLKSFGKALVEILSVIHALRDAMQVDFRGFSDLSVEQVMAATGLSKPQAKQAKTRDFSEPIIWNDSEASWLAFSDKLNEYQINHHRGGRFIHLSGGGDKGQAVQWLKACYAADQDQSPTLMALGDGNNDIPMLKVADIPVIIRSPVNALPEIAERDDMIITEALGPAGWNHAVLEVLNQSSE